MESLGKAMLNVEAARNDLKQAVTDATALEFLILLPLIERATLLARDINALISAREEDS